MQIIRKDYDFDYYFVLKHNLEPLSRTLDTDNDFAQNEQKRDFLATVAKANNPRARLLYLSISGRKRKIPSNSEELLHRRLTKTVENIRTQILNYLAKHEEEYRADCPGAEAIQLKLDFKDIIGAETKRYEKDSCIDKKGVLHRILRDLK